MISNRNSFCPILVNLVLINFPLNHLNDHYLEETQNFQAWTDSVTLRRISDQGVMDAEFEITDTESPREGDYYFVRVLSK